MAVTAADSVPETKNLADIYPEDALKNQSTRWNSLLKSFQETYNKSPDFVSRSPGRVNIIGEVCVAGHKSAVAASRGRESERVAATATAEVYMECES